MSFTIYPAIDIRGGKCVRLFQGDYAQETVYGESPVEVAAQWVKEGASWLHLVDLDGAKNGMPTNFPLMKEIAESVEVPIQVGGGIRSLETIKAYVDAGVARIILGTVAVEDPAFTKQALEQFGSKLAIGLDCRNGYVATRGWLSDSEVKAVELAQRLVEYGAETFIYTDIARDGTLTGPNTEEIVQLARETGKQVIASGGVSSLADLLELARHRSDGVEGAIVGKALYTKAFSLREALAQAKGAGSTC
ncbi:1-(5-phosphoribosyl)-5-[(5-phosphoribosylamino)methylideneamino]imidazole-4-carboxamide isomerase [Brevibacillus daliensis]|uniref:1-(5-phosphoribosyl)-5-[(5- phosphoribosylamino)methylideneamino]imidazole-4- carboxamide isomerase n=1 Tax=Brevibacillus daliensis TaxID=2892995 RepID=UPI001E5A0974|nr:1-(5-phosphoribosyl)-5-[(5-phosphoribosylamino)methylideneamino]imidazole-4-carboxamide isomerase [Brevibacillus daliensis]